MTDTPETTKTQGSVQNGTSTIQPLSGGDKQKVMSSWEYLDVTKVAARMAEFFSEGVTRASAHVQVSWANIKNQGFAVVTQLIKSGQEIARLMQNLTRENREALRQRFGLDSPGPSA